MGAGGCEGLAGFDEGFVIGVGVGEEVIAELDAARLEDQDDGGAAELEETFFLHFFDMACLAGVDDAADAEGSDLYEADGSGLLGVDEGAGSFVFAEDVGATF